jgi:hypothetical protein
VHLEASTKPDVHRKFEIFWTNIASTMACPNFKNGLKTGLCPLGVKVYTYMIEKKKLPFDVFSSHPLSVSIEKRNLWPG